MSPGRDGWLLVLNLHLTLRVLDKILMVIVPGIIPLFTYC